ncbi:MAG: cyclic nucleotide-binding domain protein [Herbinix sp.]|jgi:CRP-like cAMP-binding protein|nr:cyclic nucleotide-binding domain protein [Herbinix sp.]
MIKVTKEREIDQYIKKYSIDDLFSKDMKPYMEILYYKKNEHILKEGDELRYLLFLVEGKAKVYTALSNGKSLLLCFYQSFKVLGDVEILDGDFVTSNVQAIEDTYCIGISCEQVRNLLMEDSKFLRFLSISIGKKLVRCSKNSSINLLYPLENRLSSYIMTTGERVIEQNVMRIVFHENLTEIAELLGTSYRHLLRTIQSLCEKGVLRKNKEQYEVLDQKELKELSSDLYQ